MAKRTTQKQDALPPQGLGKPKANMTPMGGPAKGAKNQKLSRKARSK